MTELSSKNEREAADEKQFDDLSQLLSQPPEPLIPELQMYFEDTGPLGPCLRHPLVYSIIHHPQMNARANKCYYAKKKAISKAVDEQAWHTAIYLHERPYRLEAFMDVSSAMADDDYWEVLGSIWTDSENIWQNEDGWRDCLTSERPGRELMMHAEERAALLHDYDDVIHIYRGFQCRGRESGLSWTSNRITAKWFARRLAQPDDTQYLAEGFVNKEHVIAFFDGRSEQEMVVLPENIIDMKVIEICPSKQ